MRRGEYQASNGVFVKSNSLDIRDFRLFHTWVEYYAPSDLLDLGLVDSFVEEHVFEPSRSGLEVYFAVSGNELFFTGKDFSYSGLAIKYGDVLLEGWGAFVCGELTAISLLLKKNVCDLYIERSPEKPQLYSPRLQLIEDTAFFQQELFEYLGFNTTLIEVFPHNRLILAPSQILLQ
jgi:hypothetical protein